MRLKRKLALIFGLLLFPAISFANAGTALMWAKVDYWRYGNAIIGLLEGLLLAGLFKVRWWQSILLILAANFASGWAGRFLFSPRMSKIPGISIDNVSIWFWVFVAVSFVATLLIEYPFFWFALRKGPKAVSRALKATFLIQGISYLVLFGWYWSASDMSMITRLDVVSAEKLCPEDEYALFFVTPDNRCVALTDLAGKIKQTVCDLSATKKNVRFFVRQNIAGKYDLLVYLKPDESGKRKEKIIARDFLSLAPTGKLTAESRPLIVEDTRDDFGRVPSLAPATDWEYYTGFWAAEGIHGTNKKDGSEFRFSLETPFVAWAVRNATQIEGGYVVLQLDPDQICLFHPQTRKIALIARGKGPVVAKEKFFSN
jgi:hypothetical protein